MQKLHHYYGDDLRLELPTGSGQWTTLAGAAGELSRRLVRLFLPDDEGRRPVHGETEKFQHDPCWRERAKAISFYE